MLFNSFEYLVFFLFALVSAWLLRRHLSFRALLITALSYFFYVTNNHWLILLIVISTLIDYLAARRIDQEHEQKAKKKWLVLSLATNLSILGFFKYFNFASHSISALLNGLGIPLDWVDLNIFLPVGISFYTFQSMSYTIDVYRGLIPVERSLLRFACYISYFPQLIAGPIVRAQEFLPQIKRSPRLDVTGLERSLFLIFSGLVKKIIFADFLALHADAFFNAATQAGTLEAWLGMYAFCFQIYFDFSGYTDIAVGCAGLMGFDLPDNFNAPYASASFSDFWRRWHMTLSRWFRDYLYIPLGGSRSHVYRNLLLTMTLCGLWHGAAWTFVAWGLMHGVLLCIERFTGADKSASATPLRTLLVFQCIALSWIPFRAQNFGEVRDVIAALFRLHPGTGVVSISMLCAAALMMAALLWQHTCGDNFRRLYLRLPVSMRGLAYALAWCAIMVFNSAGTKEFIYFQF